MKLEFTLVGRSVLVLVYKATSKGNVYFFFLQIIFQPGLTHTGLIPTTKASGSYLSIRKLSSKSALFVRTQLTCFYFA